MSRKDNEVGKMARQGSSAQREEAYEGNGGRRNPYLVAYEGQRRRRPGSGGGLVNLRRQMPSGRAARQAPEDSPWDRRREDSGNRPERYRIQAQEDRERECPETVDVVPMGERNGAARRHAGSFTDAPRAEYSRNRQSEAAMNRSRSYPEAFAAGRARSRREEPESGRIRSRREEPEVGLIRARHGEPEPEIGRTRSRREEPEVSRARSRREEPEVGLIRGRHGEPEIGRARSRREEPEIGLIRSRRNAPGARRGMAQAERAMSRRSRPRSARPVSCDLAPVSRPASGRASAAHRRAAAQRKKKQLLMQKMLVCAWVACILVFAVAFATKNNQDARKEDVLPVMGELDENPTPQGSGLSVQGIPAEKFAAHPEWTEDLLTPNEYSRPGNALEAVNNIFVHYTANPGTSAAQNRSYFEWQKDTHEASVSAHFVIGYEGEIIQCVPLDEIAYAVMTRNYDSISIECCYLEKDGSFTQATYDSLISLLAWLVDVYDLDSEDILRHYDCGGKKCPLYYTEHPGAWEQLKKDVDNL